MAEVPGSKRPGYIRLVGGAEPPKRPTPVPPAKPKISPLKVINTPPGKSIKNVTIPVPLKDLLVAVRELFRQIANQDGKPEELGTEIQLVIDHALVTPAKLEPFFRALIRYGRYLEEKRKSPAGDDLNNVIGVRQVVVIGEPPEIPEYKYLEVTFRAAGTEITVEGALVTGAGDDYEHRPVLATVTI